MSDAAGPVLSKSRFLAGLQCPKRLWTELHARHLLPAVDGATQARFDEGHAVGELAKDLYPQGIEIGPGVRRWEDVVPETRAALERRVPLYEAAFQSGGAACRVDILVPVAEDRWDVMEVKSTTRVKDVHLSDLALQAHVLEGSGLSVRDCFVVHLDTDYLRDGPLEPQALFHSAKVTPAVRALQSGIAVDLQAMLEVGRSPRRPEVTIGKHCRRPYACPLMADCWSFLPPHNVFDLVGSRERSLELFSTGLLELRDIPESTDLDRRQRIQLETERSGEAHVDRQALEEFLATLSYPLYYFDLESVSAAIPRFDRSRPYQQIPFLFSVHRVGRPGEAARHFAYIYDGNGDPRADFLRAARASLGTDGSIVAYNVSFERRVLEETAATAVPELEEWAVSLRRRYVDLLVPFREFSYHHPDQLGSSSLKAVLGPLTGMSYEDLEIADGERASREYLRVTLEGFDPIQRAQVLRQIEEYCSLDTLAMVAIVDQLEEQVSRKQT